MALGDFLGNMGIAAQGFQDGRERVMDLQDKEDRNSYAKQVREADRGLLPLRTEASRVKLQAGIDEQGRQNELAPIKHDIDRQVLQAERELTPGKVELAKGELQLARDQQAISLIDQVFKGAATTRQAEEGILTMVGESLSQGDTAGALQMFKHLQAAFPGYNEIPEIQSGRMVKTKDAQGREVDAVEVTFADGRTSMMDPSRPVGLYRKRLEQQAAARAKPVNINQRLVDPATGRIILDADPNTTRWSLDENGNPIFGLGGAGGAGGTGTRSGGKAPPTPESNALDAFEKIYKNAETKLQPTQLADGQDYVVQAMRQGAETPEQAARIALDAVTNPDRITPDLDARTGQWSGVYRNPAIQAGKAFNLARNFVTTDELVKQKGGEAVVRDGVTKLLDSQAQLIAPNNPQAQAAIREQFIVAAHDKRVREQMEAIARERGGPDELANLQRKLDMIKAWGPKPPARRDSSAAPASAPTAPRTEVDPNSPAGRAQARQQAAREEAARRRAAEEQAQAELGSQFDADMQSMPREDFIRKYDALRGQLSRDKALQLLQFENRRN